MSNSRFTCPSSPCGLWQPTCITWDDGIGREGREGQDKWIKRKWSSNTVAWDITVNRDRRFRGHLPFTDKLLSCVLDDVQLCPRLHVVRRLDEPEDLALQQGHLEDFQRVLTEKIPGGPRVLRLSFETTRASWCFSASSYFDIFLRNYLVYLIHL